MLVNRKEFLNSLKTALSILNYRHYNPPKLKNNLSDYLLLVPNEPFLSVIATNNYVLYYSNIPATGEKTLFNPIIMYAYQAREIIDSLKTSKSKVINVYENKLNEDLLINNGSIGIPNIKYDYPHYNDLFLVPIEKVFRVETQEIKDRIKLLGDLRRNAIKSKVDYYNRYENLRFKLNSQENILYISIDGIDEEYTVIPAIGTNKDNMLNDNIILTFDFFNDIIKNIKTKEVVFCLSESKDLVSIIPVSKSKLYLIKNETFFIMQRKKVWMLSKKIC